MEDLYIYRPLWPVDPDDPEDVKMEALIRATIDAITGGFYYTREWYEGEGLGADFFPTPALTRDVLEGFEKTMYMCFKKYNTTDRGKPRVYESSLVCNDKDMTAITIETNFQHRLLQQSLFRIKHGMSDSYATHDQHWIVLTSPMVGTTFLVGDCHRRYPVIPDDIKLVAGMLKKQYEEEGNIGGSEMDDYITEYSTDQFKLVMDSRAGENN